LREALQQLRASALRCATCATAVKNKIKILDFSPMSEPVEF
jgi:hypothetical protein